MLRVVVVGARDLVAGAGGWQRELRLAYHTDAQRPHCVAAWPSLLSTI